MQNKYFSLGVLLGLLVFMPLLRAEEMARKKVVVMDFGMKPNALQLGPEFAEVLDGKVSSLLTRELVESLRKYPGLEVLESIRNESLKGGVEKAKGLGTDYLVLANIELIEVKKKIDELWGELVVNLRVVDVLSGQVIYADEVRQQEVECLNKDTKVTPSEFMESLKVKGVRQMATRITETIWPIKIATLYGGYAFLDRGQAAQLQRGMRLAIFIPTRPITDPNTGEVISNTEYRVGELRITEVLPKVTKTQIIKYTMPISVGLICRTLEEVEKKCK